jgi:hypothetical protein
MKPVGNPSVADPYGPLRAKFRSPVLGGLRRSRATATAMVLIDEAVYRQPGARSARPVKRGSMEDKVIASLTKSGYKVLAVPFDSSRNFLSLYSENS